MLAVMAISSAVLSTVTTTNLNARKGGEAGPGQALFGVRDGPR